VRPARQLRQEEDLQLLWIVGLAGKGALPKSGRQTLLSRRLDPEQSLHVA
jgi:hypothetical protein